MQIGPAEQKYDFSFERLDDASGSSTGGVFVLFRDAQVIFVGDSPNVRSELESLLKGSNACITRYKPNRYQYQVYVTEDSRKAKVEELLQIHKPACP